MSWDRGEYTEISICACGKGKVVRKVYIEDDDWNRTRGGVLSEEICCSECKKKFHIEHYTRHYICPSWESDGVIDQLYLVPNNLVIPSELSERKFCFSIDEQIVAKYSFEEILAAKKDMIQNRYSTRLERKSSQEIVALYAKKYKKRKLTPIVELLNNLEKRYYEYEWNPQRLKEFRDKEKVKIQENKQAIADALEQSFELNFRRITND